MRILGFFLIIYSKLEIMPDLQNYLPSLYHGAVLIYLTSKLVCEAEFPEGG